MRRANTTFVNLRATLDDLEPLVDESKPVAKKLRPFLAELRPLARDARPTLRDLSRARALARRRQRPDRADEVAPCRCATSPSGRRQAQRQAARRRASRPRRRRSTAGHAGARATARPYAPDLTGWFDDFSHSGVYDALGGASRAAPYVNAVRARQRRAQAAARPRCAERRLQAHASLAGPAQPLPGRRSSAAPTWKPHARLPLRRLAGAARAMRRVARSPSLVLAGAGVGWIVLDRRRATNPDKGTVLGRVRQRLRPRQGRRPEGRRRARGQDHRASSSTRRTKHALVGFKIDKNGLRLAARGRLLRVAPAVADRRVLRRLPARHGASRSSSRGAIDPGQRTRRRRSRPTSSTTSCAAPTASACRSSSTSSAPASAGNAPRTSTTRSAAPARRCARPTRCSRSSAAQNQILGDLTRQRRHGRRRPRRQPQGRRALRRRGASDTAQASAERRARHRRRPPAAAGLPASSCGRRWPRSAQPPTRRRPRCANLNAVGRASSRASSTTSARSRTPRGPAFQVAGQASKTGDQRGQGGARPVVAQLDAFAAEHAGARQEPRDRPRAPRRPQARGREGPALARAARATPASRRCSSTSTTRRPSTSIYDAEQPHPQGRRLRRAVRRLRRRDARRSRRTRTRARQRLRSRPRARTSPASTTADADRRAGADDAGPRRAPARRRRPRPAAARPRRHRRRPRRAPAAATSGARDAAPPAPTRRRRPCRRRPPERAADPAADAPGPAAQRPGGRRRCRRCRARRADQRDRRPRPAPRLPARRHERAADPRLRSSPTPCSSGAVTDARRHRRRLPGLQRQQRACRSCRRASSTCASPTAPNLVKGNEVRSGGFRIGVVDDMKPVMLPDGTGRRRAHAQARQEGRRGPGRLDGRRSARARRWASSTSSSTTGTSKKDVPRRRDAARRARRRSRSSSTRSSTCSTSRRGAPRRTTCRASATRSPAAAPTSTRRSRSRRALFGHLEPVMAQPAAPRTELPRFFKELGDAARIVAPVSKTNAHLFTDDGRHLRGDLARPAGAQGTRSPRARRRCDAGTASLRVQRPFLEHTAALSRDLDARRTELRGALPTSTARCDVGTPVQRRSVALNDDLQGALGALSDLVEAPTTLGALRGLTATVGTLQPQLRYLGPYVTVCNSWNILLDLRGRALLGARRHRVGSQRALLNMAPQQPGPTASARRAPTSSPTARARCPARRRRSTCTTTSTAPAIDDDGQRRLRRRPARLHLRPTTRCATRASRATPTRAPSTERFPVTGQPRPDLRAVRQGGQGPSA